MREALDSEQIAELMWNYTRAIDTWNEDACAQAFTPDGAFGPWLAIHPPMGAARPYVARPAHSSIPSCVGARMAQWQGEPPASDPPGTRERTRRSPLMPHVDLIESSLVPPGAYGRWLSWRRATVSDCNRSMADGVGFEPTVGFHPRRFSRPLPSTTRPPIPQGAALIICSRPAPACVGDDVG